MPEPIRVLLADDHAVVRAGIRQFLDRAGDIVTVAEVSDGAGVQKAVQEYVVDVTILDIFMPDMNGIEVAGWLQRHYAGIALLALSAYDDLPYVTAALEAGCLGYLLKTAAPSELAQAVRDVYQGKMVVDQDLLPQILAHGGKERFKSKGPGAADDVLTGRELEVLSLAGHGLTNKAIGMQLGISGRTVQGHLAHIFRKLHVNSRTEAVVKAVSLGLVKIETQD